MTRDDAIALRMRQLRGEPVDAGMLARALEIIATPVPRRVGRPRGPHVPRTQQPPKRVRARWPRVENPWSLTGAQVEVLRLYAQGMCNGEVAQAMSLSPKTVSTHMTRIIERIDARNSLHAVLVFDRWARAAGAC